MEREQLSEERRVKDPRTEEEQEHARELCSLILVSTNRKVASIPLTVNKNWTE